MAGSSQKRQQNQKTRKDDQLDEKHVQCKEWLKREGIFSLEKTNWTFMINAIHVYKFTSEGSK